MLHLFGYRCIGKPSRAHSRLPPAGHVGPRLGQQVGREESSKMYLTEPPCGNLVVRPWRPLLLSTRCTRWLRPPGRWKPPTAHLAVRCTQRQLGVLLVVVVVVVGASGGHHPVDDGHAQQQLHNSRQSLESSVVLSFQGAASSRMNVRSPFLLGNIFPFLHSLPLKDHYFKC